MTGELGLLCAQNVKGTGNHELVDAMEMHSYDGTVDNVAWNCLLSLRLHLAATDPGTASNAKATILAAFGWIQV